ncbi:ligand-dependent nuclear receptor-interacting factor 1 isoform X1 [Astyanax mexicanus]|uniref:Ligand-dependent nuclear receptor-interacting factor 1 isoform X1 n=1 Tax=Astyanax mexicanus TaxID=7994 RepID=A0A8B9RBL6_ASTMX|nr:ligand-dependent nuclear receptor-interacting factor 1 isoform X1 [Astyanax mexicanus]
MENGTGVYYQAMPAVGPDGKNVMKLIPVQKVNGKFVQTHVISARTDHQPQVHHHPTLLSPVSLPHNNLPTLQPTADGRFILKMPPDSNTLLNPLKSQLQGTNDLLKNTLNQVRPPLVAPTLTQHALQLPLQSNSKPVTVISSPQQPVSGKSPIFSSGHYLQIPPNATVRTLPASALPQSIKSQICTSLNAPNNSANGLSTVLYVSPVNSLKLGPSQQVPGLMKETVTTQSSTPMPTISSVKSLNVTSTSGPKPDEGASTPMRWVVQEGTGSTAPFLIPVTSPSMTTDIIKAVKQMETEKQMNQGTAGKRASTSSTAIQEKISPGKDSALVMCNGKVYFVAKKSSENTKDVISGAGSNLNVRNFVQPPSVSNTVPKQDSVQTPSSKNPNEIIDLCDDEEESSPSTALSTLSVPNENASENDEDSNVIFVSYIPPKSETDTSTKAADTSSQHNSEKDKASPDCDTRNITNSPVIDLDVSRCEDHAAADKRVNGGGAVSEQLEEVCKEVIETISVDSGIQFNEMSWEEPALEEVQQQKSDSELRKIFGIMSDVRICLQKLKEAKAASPQPERRTVNKRTLEGIRKLIQDSQIQQKVKKLMDAQVQVPKGKNGPEDAKRKRLAGPEQKTCLDTSVSKDVVKGHNEMQSMSTDACTDSKVLLYCQGSDEETPTENLIEPLCSSSSSFQSQQTQTGTCGTNGKACMAVSRRTPARQSKGNGRVCTACPCGTKVGAIAAISPFKSLEKPNRPAVIDPPKQASVLTGSNRDCKNVGKVLNKPVTSPPKSSVASGKSGDEKLHSTELHTKPAKGLNPSSLSMQHDVSHSSSSSVNSEEAASSSTSSNNAFIELYSSVMLDPEELKRQERIKRLKVLLKEKEAALEKLRQSM